MATTQIQNPSPQSTYANPILDGALRNIGSDFDVFGRQLAACIISAARDEDRQNAQNTHAGSASNPGNGTASKVNYRTTLSVEFTAAAGDSLAQMAVETPKGRVCINVPTL